MSNTAWSAAATDGDLPNTAPDRSDEDPYGRRSSLSPPLSDAAPVVMCGLRLLVVRPCAVDPRRRPGGAQSTRVAADPVVRPVVALQFPPVELALAVVPFASAGACPARSRSG